MKHKLAYSPRQKLPTDYNSINSRSPPRLNGYESSRHLQDVAFRQNHYVPQFKDFNNLRKLPQDVQVMRHTMNSRGNRRLGSLDRDEDQKPNIFDEFLRHSYKTQTKHIQQESQQNSRQPCFKKDNQRCFKSENGDSTVYQDIEIDSNEMDRIGRKVEIERSGREYERISHRQRIEEWKKPIKYDRNLLKNVNHNKHPSYIDLDHQNQLQDYNFKKMRKDEEFPTPIQTSNRNNAEETIISNQTSALGRKKSNRLSKKAKLGIDQFDQGKKLGEGKYGVVNLVQHRKTGSIFALKKITKALIKSHMMIEQLALQIHIQSCLTHPSILSMYGFFDDKTHLYIVLEYMDGGTLYQALKSQIKLSQQETARTIKEITSALDYMHDRGIAHRDLKPENIVRSNNVYKLCDFGWAAICTQRRKTYCGTFDYVAPQILQGVEYDITVDLWCLGVMTYQLMTGKAPFYHISRKETMKKILNVENQNIEFPEDMSEVAKDFIEKLVRKNPAERIKTSEALNHPFLMLGNTEENTL